MIKNILLTLTLALLGLSIEAQVLVITPADSVAVEDEVSSNNDETVLYAYVRNDSTDTLTVRWRVNSNTSPVNWNVSYCDNTNCLDLATTTQSTFLLAPDSTSILKMAYLPFLEAGESNVSVSVSIDGVPGTAQNVIYYAKIEVNPNGISSLDVNSLSIFPNPTTNFIQVKGIENANDVNAIEVYSIIGKKVMHKDILTLNDLKVDVHGLDNGVYLVKLFDNKKSVFYTKTFVKK